MRRHAGRVRLPIRGMNDGNGKKGNGPRLGIVTNRSPSVLRGLQAVLFVMRASILDDEGLQILAFVVETITYRRMFYIGAP